PVVLRSPRSYEEKGFLQNDITLAQGVRFRPRTSRFEAWSEENAVYLIEKSEPTRVTARCANLKCKWNIHAYIMDDNVTFEVKKLVKEHSCIRSNKGGNRRATQGWIANVVSDKLKFDGDVSVTQLRKWLMKHYNVELPYQKNPEIIIDINFERNGDKKCFQRFFISLVACFMGFLTGCRPYISLDACHLKGKFNDVLVVATGINGNSSMFPVAYGILESENTSSWICFLELLKKAIWTPHGLVISSDMKKGLEVAITQVYPDAEHRECLWHLYSNFKKQFRGDFYNEKLWGAAKTYSVNVHDRLLNGIADPNDWEMLMARFNKKRRVVSKWKGTLVPTAKTYLKNISKNLGEYAVCRSSDNRAEVKHKGKRWEVVLDEKKNALVEFGKLKKFKEAYALEIAPLHTIDHWVPRESGENFFLPPVFKLPIGRPRKNRIVAHDESKRKK
ncbi:uncharacterized protein Tco_1031605, partial [Tanacetum coccineum]